MTKDELKLDNLIADRIVILNAKAIELNGDSLFACSADQF